MFKCLKIIGYVPNIMRLGICLKIASLSNLAHLLDTASKFVLFSVSSLKDEKKAQLYLHVKRNVQTLFYLDSILNISGFCQMSSKSIHIISSYTVSK